MKQKARHHLHQIRPLWKKINGCSCAIPQDQCTSFQEAIFTSQSASLTDDNPYNFFTHGDLYYSGILDHRNEKPRLFKIWLIGDAIPWYKDSPFLQKQRWKTGNVHGYNCQQSQHQFPSFHFNAVLDDQNADCEVFEVRIENWRFWRLPASMTVHSLTGWSVIKVLHISEQYSHHELAMQSS